MWLTSSSIGRKVVMSVTGACLVLFLTFHMLMNLVYVYDVMVSLVLPVWLCSLSSISSMPSS